MKRIVYKLTLTLFILFGFLSSQSQTFEIRTSENEMGYLTVQMRETSGVGTPTTATNIVDITFVVRYPSGAVDIDLLCSTNEYNIVDGLAGEQTFGGYDYHYWNASNTPFNPPSNWTQNEWEDIAVFYASGATGSGLFEIAPNNWDGRSLNWNQEGTDYTPTLNGNIIYAYPTIVYNYVWTGLAGGPPAQNNGYKWENTSNWASTCSGDPLPEGSYPYFGQVGAFVFIPAGLAKYPELSTNIDAWGWACNKLFIEDGAHITVPDLTISNPSNPELYVDGDMVVEGVLNLSPKGHATVTGSTTINSAEGIVVQADASGVGSFIDNGTITYGGSGSAKVQTYLSNAAGAGDFYIHQVGPTVDDEGYTGSGTGADLSAFNVASGSTYAYYWDESEVLSGDNDQGWKNIYSLNYHVETGSGIALSTTDATNHTMEMTGQLITGNVSTPTLAFTQNHYELISNPYPSAIDFDALATANSGVVFAKYWIWDPATGNYISRVGTTGGSQFVQVGQSFFVETVAGGTFNFTNTNRIHNTVAFRNASENTLHLNVSGGDFGFEDNLYVRFDEVASSGYDLEIESEKWVSRYPDATSISSFAADGTELAINVLPMDYLMNQMSSVPLNFVCGYETGYVFKFDGLETFEVGTEIWLEDKLTGGDWVSLNTQSEYSFTASPDDASDRFVLHFFGPTGTEELASPVIDLYSFGQYAYVRNNTDDIIQDLSIYALGGKLVKHIHKVDQKFLKLYVGNETAYYVIVAVTDKEVFTKKIFISK